MATPNVTTTAPSCHAIRLGLETIDHRLNDILALAMSAKDRIERAPEGDQDITLRHLVGMIEDIASNTAGGDVARLISELRAAAT